MKDETAIARYTSYPLPELKKLAQDAFNAYVRERDKGKPCISCDEDAMLQAGHLYPTKQYPWLALEENNCAGQCENCNLYKRGNTEKYREGLISRIGEAEVIALDELAAFYKRTHPKLDRFHYIDKIIHYRTLIKTNN